MNKRATVLLIFLISFHFSKGQSKPDSVVIKVGESSKVTFSIGDKKDLETLKQYNFQAVVDDVITKLENKDTTKLDKAPETYQKTEEPTSEARRNDNEEDWNASWEKRRDAYRNDDKIVDKDVDREVNRTVYTNDNNRNRYNSDNYSSRNRTRYYGQRTRHSFNFDLGTNNFLVNQAIPDQDPYTVRPWGSWFVGVNSIERTRVGGKFFVEWGLGVSFYNFKFEDESMTITKTTSSVIFAPDTRPFNFSKSKLTATYLNASLIPMIDFGGNSRKAMIFDGKQNRSFRFGVGPYAGYRIDSYTKLMYTNEEGEKKKEINHDSFYLNNIRYGVRVQIGLRDTDVFFTYDLNTVFAKNKGPNLNAFSFGITL